MHPAALDTRNREARQRITTAAATLSDALAIAPLVGPDAIELRQPAIAHLRELEGVADVLEAVVRALNEPQEVIEYHCPDCETVTRIEPGTNVCRGCGKPLAVVQVA